MAVDIRIVNADHVARKLGPDLIAGPRAGMVHDAAVFAQREAQSGARGLGGVPSSLMADTRDMQARVYSRHPGAFPTEVGRRAGAPMPPTEAIARWASRHGIPAERAFVIARAIARRGIRGRFYLKHARERLLSTEMPRLMTRAAEEIAAAWGSR